MSTADLESLADVSRRLGSRVDCVQGGGGNTSMKADERTMWIKASGLALSAVTPADGFVAVDYPALLASLPSCQEEGDYNRALRCSVSAHAVRRPSIETGFHALMPQRVILHSHSVWINLLACAANGAGMAAKIFPKAGWLPYATPGLALMKSAAALLEKQSPDVLILQNHGVAVGSNDAESAWRMHEEIGLTIQRAFHLPASMSDGAGALPGSHELLFPDQAVYLHDPTLRESMAGRQTLQAYSFLRRTMADNGLEPHFLPQQEVEKLLSMESEKYRQKLVT